MNRIIKLTQQQSQQQNPVARMQIAPRTPVSLDQNKTLQSRSDSQSEYSISTKPIEIRSQHQDLQQVTQNKYIKAPFNQVKKHQLINNKSILKSQAISPIQVSRQLSNGIGKISISNYSALSKQEQFLFSPYTNQAKSLVYTANGNKILIHNEKQSNIQSSSLQQSSYNFNCVPYSCQFRQDINRRINPQVFSSPINFYNNHQSQFNSGQINNVPNSFQPATSNIKLLSSIQQSSLFKQAPKNLQKHNIQDQEQQVPLKNRIHSSIKQRTKSFISEQQIKKGFNSGLKNAREKVKKQSILQQENHSISIVSNLINQSYSPARKQRDSEQKKKKRPIFDSSIKNVSHVQEYRPKTASLQQQSIVSFGTPQSIKRNINLENDGVFEYELKTENKNLFKEQKSTNCNYKDENQLSIVPQHILTAWKKIKEN